MKLQTDFSIIGGAGLALLALGACASNAQTPQAPTVSSVVNGPAADYPIVLGEPYSIDGVLHTPLDTLNYDHVGYLAADDQTANGVTGSHRTLPLPSYVEVTALETGRTILVRLERRGPMRNDRLIALSPAAIQQLGAAEGSAIRMRRVNPPEEHRMELRAGREAPLRMDTPSGLLEVLKRRLPQEGSAPLTDPRQEKVSGEIPTPGAIATLDPNEELGITSSPEESAQPVEPVEAVETVDVSEEIETVDLPASTTEEPLPEDPKPPLRPELPMTVEGGPERAPLMLPIDADGKFAVQLGAFSKRDNADRLAREVQGYVETSGKFSLVRVGPFATRGQAEQALAMLRKRGYSDALIRPID